MNGAISMLAAAVLAGTIAGPLWALPGKSLYAGSAKAPAGPSESVSPASEAELPPPPPPAATPAMEDKFRKLQKEMERKDGAPKASPSGNFEKEKTSDGISAGSLVMQILLGLVFVLLLAVVSIRGLKRLQGRILSKPGKGGDILEVLETCHLGTQQRVVAIRMNQEVGILGVTQQGISLITILKEPIEELRRAQTGESNSEAFSDSLNKLLERFKKPKKVSDMLDEEAA